MARCETCGNEYDQPLQVTSRGRTGTYDSFECAIQGMAPRCGHCGVAIVGHGVESETHFYCCDHCMRMHANVTPASREAR